jgi:hypothetical protein
MASSEVPVDICDGAEANSRDFNGRGWLPCNRLPADPIHPSACLNGVHEAAIIR